MLYRSARTDYSVIPVLGFMIQTGLRYRDRSEVQGQIEVFISEAGVDTLGVVMVAAHADGRPQ